MSARQPPPFPPEFLSARCESDHSSAAKVYDGLPCIRRSYSTDNYEVLIKVLDACDSSGHFWFFAAGLTDLPVTILLQDQATGRTFTFESPGGRPFEPILDFTTLSCDD